MMDEQGEFSVLHVPPLSNTSVMSSVSYMYDPRFYLFHAFNTKISRILRERGAERRQI